MVKLTIDEITPISGKIIDAAIEVHKYLGPGLLEKSYETALCYELEQRGLSFERQKRFKLNYKSIELDSEFRLDLLVEDNVIVELKCCDKLLPIHEAQLMTYLKIVDRRVGLLLNFNMPLLKDGIKRIAL